MASWLITRGYIRYVLPPVSDGHAFATRRTGSSVLRAGADAGGPPRVAVGVDDRAFGRHDRALPVGDQRAALRDERGGEPAQSEHAEDLAGDPGVMGVGLLAAPAVEVQIQPGQPAPAIDQKHRPHVTHPQVIVDQRHDLHALAAGPGRVAGLLRPGDHRDRLESSDGTGNSCHVPADPGQHRPPDVMARRPGHPGPLVPHLIAGHEPALTARAACRRPRAGLRPGLAAAFPGRSAPGQQRPGHHPGYRGSTASQHGPAGDAPGGVHRKTTAFPIGICQPCNAAAAILGQRRSREPQPPPGTTRPTPGLANAGPPGRQPAAELPHTGSRTGSSAHRHTSDDAIAEATIVGRDHMTGRTRSQPVIGPGTWAGRAVPPCWRGRGTGFQGTGTAQTRARCARAAPQSVLSRPPCRRSAPGAGPRGRCAGRTPRSCGS